MILESPCVEDGIGLSCTEEGFAEATSLGTAGGGCELLRIAEEEGTESCVDVVVGRA